MTINDGHEKSNRLKADYYELLIAKKLSEHYEITINIDDKINEVKSQITKFDDGYERIEEQERRAVQTFEELIVFFEEKWYK